MIFKYTRRMNTAMAVALSALATLSMPALASADDSYTTTTLTNALEHPWGMDMLPDGRFLVTERPGRMRIVSADGSEISDPLPGLPPIWVDNQAGLFEVKLAPDFEQSQRIYFSYACGERRDSSTCLARATLHEHELREVEEIFRADAPRAGSAHYGARFAFLPDDTIVLGLGDGFDYREQAQRPQNHFGSIVRLNMDGTVPANNPFIGLAHAAPETYSYGHRNVQGLVFDSRRQRLYSSEHGPRGGDELNLMRPGDNYGWPLITGGVDYNNAQITPFSDLPDMTAPLLEWTPSIAPSGMTIYRGDAFPEWRGDIFVSALAAQKVQRVRLTGTRVEHQEALFTELKRRIRYIYTGTDGLLYLLTDHADGELIQVAPTP